MASSARPIKQILLAAFLLVALMPIIAMSLLAFNEAKQALKTEIQRDMQTRVNGAAVTVDRLLFERFQNILSWRQLEVMQDLKVDDVDKRISNVLHELKMSYQDSYLELYTTDNSGKVVASSDPRRIGQAVPPFRPWVNIPYASQLIQMYRLNDARLPLATPIQDNETGEVLGTLYVEFNWQTLVGILKTAATSELTNVALMDTDHQIIYQTAPHQAKDHARYIHVQAKVNQLQPLRWHLEIAQPKEEAMAPVTAMTNIFILLLISSIALASAIAIPVAHSITAPLFTLTVFANRYIHNPQQPLPAIAGPSEIQALSSAFNKMLHDLETSKQALTRAAKLAVAGEMAAAMSHEVRTPLGILRSSAQLLMREPNLNAEAKEVCGFIMSETDRLNRLVNTLLDTARPRQPNFTETDVSQLLNQAISMMRMQADKKQVSITLEAPAQMHLVCDREQITQVLFNLILNAVQILSEGQRIHIRAAQDDDQLTLHVIDSGPGVPASQRNQLFDPFFTQREGGIGLGLAVVRQIIESHQGTIDVQNGDLHSGLNGAVFEVKLPRHLAA